MIRKATAVWRGIGQAGNGDLTTESGVLSQTAYSFKTRFENARGTNPEELLAAAHAGCFTMAVAFRLQAAGYTATELTTQAAVTAVPDEQGRREDGADRHGSQRDGEREREQVGGADGAHGDPARGGHLGAHAAQQKRPVQQREEREHAGTE